MPNILVIAEMLDGKVRKSTHSAITFARNAGGTFSILVLGQGAKAAAAEVTGFGAQKVLVCDDANLASPVAEVFAPTIAAVAKNGFDVIAVTASSFGKDVAPRVAGKLGAGYAPDISGVKDEGGKLVYKRPVFAGNAYATCTVNTPVQVVSVRQSEFSAAEPSGALVEEPPPRRRVGDDHLRRLRGRRSELIASGRFASPAGVGPRRRSRSSGPVGRRTRAPERRATRR